MEASKKERGALNRAFRKAMSITAFGVILYNIVSYVLQIIVSAIYYAANGIPMDEESIAASLDTNSSGLGWVVLISVVIALALTWLYYNTKKKQPELYPGSCALKATFATGKKMTVKTLLFTAAAILGIQLLFTLIFHVIELGLNALGYTLAGSAAMETDYSVTLSLMLYAALIGPIAEELMYRGFVMRGLEKYGKIFAIVTSSVIFGLMHADFRQTILTFVIGLMFGYICIEYGIIWSCVLHIYNNYILGQLWSDLLATLPELWQNIVAYSLMTLILGLIAIVYFKNKDKVNTAPVVGQ